jgi:hypothetical protein
LFEYVVGILQNGYRVNHSISEMAERVGIITYNIDFNYLIDFMVTNLNYR